MNISNRSGTAIDCKYFSVEEYQKCSGLVIVHMNCGQLLDWKFDNILTSLVTPHLGVLALSETFFDKSTDINSFNIPNFSKFRQDRDFSQCDKLSGGGLVTYVNNKLICDGECYSPLNINNSFLECQFILIKKEHCKDIIFVNCYRPPDNRTIESRNIAINSLANNIKKIKNYQNKSLIITGDFNLDCFDFDDVLNDNIIIDENGSEISNATKPRDYIDNLCTDLGLLNLINKPTCFKGTASTVLDLILSNATNLSNYGIIDFSFHSHEHRPVFLTKQRQHDSKECEYIFVRPYKKLNLDLLYSRIDAINWSSLKSNDIDTYWINIKNQLIKICNDLCPLQKIKIRKNLPCWYSSDLSYLRFERDNLATKSRSDPLNTKKKEDAKKAANEFKKRLFVAKRDYTIDQLYECEGDQRRFWQELKKLLPLKVSSEFGCIYDDNDNLLHGVDALNYVNQYFSRINEQIDEKLKKIPMPEEPPSYHENLCFDIDSSCFSPARVKLEIDQINLNKSSGFKDLGTFFLKSIFSHAPHILSDIFCFSFESGKLPQEWKEGAITVLPKKGSTMYIENIRPITQTNLVIKTFEKIINSEMMTYFENNNILHPNQGGFRKGRSTIDTATKLVNFLATAKNEKKYSIAVYLDFSKAFDSVNHQLLLKKLSKMGIKGNLLRWITNYLQNRTQVVRNSKFCSKITNVTTGVPQGSVLGPTLFLSYINDIKFISTFSQINLFADDTVLYHRGDNLDQLINEMQSDINKVSGWSTYSRLCLNAKKTNVMCFSPSFKVHPDLDRINKLKLFGKDLTYVTECDYLGIRIDYKLFFDKFYSKVKQSASHKIFMLSKIRKYLNKQASVTVLKSMVLPFLEYGGIFLEACEQKLRDKLHRIFCRGIRIALNNFYPYFSEFDLHDEINFLPLCYRRRIMVAKYMFKEKENSNVQILNSNYQTRSQDGPVMLVPPVSNEKFKRFLPWLGPTVWNCLPSDVRNTTNYNSFVTKVKGEFKAMFSFDQYYR